MAGPNIVNVEDSQFKKEVLESPTPVLVDFWATWCAPCKAIAPALEDFASRYTGKVKVAKMNIDDNQETPQQYQITSIPTLLLFKGGQVVSQIVGAQNVKARLEDAVSRL